MGWKTFTDHFQISHLVQITTKGLCIGSPYVHNLVTINTNTGEVQQNSTFPNFLKDNYPKILESTPEEVLGLLNTEDQFGSFIPVYTYEGGEILERFCETPEWPNTTHDGCMMYENTFSTDKIKVVGWAKRHARLGINNLSERISETEQLLATYKAELEKSKADLESLETTYPDST